ncbi:transporter substrate-binding domain-containing protein [Branchiibius cervicis]|uniref:Transporter substrate-binding domain-containing protein n=1 Tax=Branchiibius cervicis TaxID=908252 RepID=A0ABW2AW89_9MICO
MTHTEKQKWLHPTILAASPRKTEFIDAPGKHPEDGAGISTSFIVGDSVRRILSLGVTCFLLVVWALLGPIGGARSEAAPRQVTVVTHEIEPFVVGTGSSRTGFSTDLWNEIASREHWTTKWVNVDTVGQQLQDLSNGSAEVGVGAISITAERRQKYDFSQPILDAGLQIAVPTTSMKSSSTPVLRRFLDMLASRTMLLWLLSAALLSLIPAHVVWLIERRHADSPISRRYFPGIVQAFGESVGGLIAADEGSPRHWMSRMLKLLWSFVGVAFVAFFTANLTASLTVEQLSSSINSPSDLYGKKVLAVEGTTSAAYLHRNGIQTTLVPSIDDMFARLRQGGADAGVGDAPVMQYLTATKYASSVAVVGTVFNDEDLGFALKDGSDLRGAIDEALLSMREDGTYTVIKQRWFGTGDSQGTSN